LVLAACGGGGGGAGRVDLTTSLTEVCPGTSVSVRWSSARASSVALIGPDGSTLSRAASGTLSVPVNATGSFALDVDGRRVRTAADTRCRLSRNMSELRPGFDFDFGVAFAFAFDLGFGPRRTVDFFGATSDRRCGTVKQKALPPAAGASTQMRPPWASTASRQNVRPRPWLGLPRPASAAAAAVACSATCGGATVVARVC
jgi:hypothetical protein